MEKERVLAVVAHPDDEVLGCGGTLAKLSGQGAEVLVAILGEGITARSGRREEADRAMLDGLKESCRKVKSLLHLKNVMMVDLPDNRFDSIPRLDIIKKIEMLIRETKPSIIFTHHEGDLNIDHEITNRAVVTAARPFKDHPVRMIAAFSVPSSTDWAFSGRTSAFCPNYFVDISATVGAKINALSAYSSEMREFPHPRSIEALRAYNRYWGSVVGCDAAEPFSIVRMIG